MQLCVSLITYKSLLSMEYFQKLFVILQIYSQTYTESVLQMIVFFLSPTKIQLTTSKYNWPYDSLLPVIINKAITN